MAVRLSGLIAQLAAELAVWTLQPDDNRRQFISVTNLRSYLWSKAGLQDCVTLDFQNLQ
jgi:hypothetical protein